MDKILTYTLKTEDLKATAGGLVNLVLKECVRVTGHEISRAKFTPLGITVDGRQAYVKDRMLPGQVLRVRLPDDEAQAQKILPAPGTPDILYEDEDVTVVNKPAGAVVHPSHGHYADSVANVLAGYFSRRGESVVPRIVGRLDKDTSGALLFAKNQAGAARLFSARKAGTFSRTYLALAHGCFEEKDGVLTRRIAPVPDALMRQQTVDDGGKEACTRYRVLLEDPARDISLLEVRIDTGRTHQIRVHMQDAGHPLLGDPLYGEDFSVPASFAAEPAEATPGRAMLHAFRLVFPQPFTGEEISVSAPVPADFAALCGACGFPASFSSFSQFSGSSSE